LKLTVAGLLAAVTFWVGFNVWFALDPRSEGLLSKFELPGALWQVVEGDGEVDNEILRLTDRDLRGWASVAALLPESLSVETFGSLRFRLLDGSGAADIRAGIASPGNLAGFADAPVRVDEKGWAELQLSDTFFQGESIGYVVLRAFGSMEPPVEFQQVALIPEPSFFQLQSMLLSSMVNLDGWTQRSINANRHETSSLNVSPVLIVLLWLIFFFVWALLLYRRSIAERRAWMPLLLFCFIAGWLVLDIGWQVTLLQRHWSAVKQYAGLESDQKRKTEADAPTYEFSSRLREQLDDPTARVAIFAGSDFTQYRARYFIAPQPAIARVGISISWIRRLRSGDAIALIGIQDQLNAFPLRISSTAERLARQFERSTITGRHAAVTECSLIDVDTSNWCTDSVIALKEEERPWLIESPWLSDLKFGLWRLHVQLHGAKEAGWVRLEVMRRAGETVQRWAWREGFVNAGMPLEVDVPFVAGHRSDFHFRLRALDQASPVVISARLEPETVEHDLVRFSRDNQPPYFIARKLLDTEAGVAYQLY